MKKKNVRKRYGSYLAVAACCIAAMGMAACGRQDLDRQKDDTTVVSENTSGDTIAAANDYDEIYEYLKAQETAQNSENGGIMKGMEVLDSAQMQGTANAKSDAAAYSDTNVREGGIGEGDLVKTDGKYLYIVNNQKIQIVEVENGELTQKASIRIGGEKSDVDGYENSTQSISEIYVADGRLIVVYVVSGYGTEGVGYVQNTVAETFDVSAVENPKSLGKISQSGNFNTMRVHGEFVYLFSDFYADTSVEKKDTSLYIPSVNGKLLESNSILLPPYVSGNEYTVVTGFSLGKPDEKIDSKAIFGYSNLTYVSENNIYVCESYYNSDEADVTQTCIRKISYKDGTLETVGQTKVKGTLNDSFSIDEYDGNLRLVTTISATQSGVLPILRIGDASDEIKEIEDSNALYVLDEKLKEIGKIEGLAKGEQIYSARFLDEVGYFVTYKQVDPLFSVDLSDAKNPKIIGALKIPGFSEYLHPYGEGKLLGIGMDADETGTTTDGVKLSMFDISNPSSVEEVQKYVLKDYYSSDLMYNYKAAMLNEEKNMIGFSCSGQNRAYYIFSYDKEGFKCLFERELSGYGEVRGIYIGDIFYLVSGNTVESYQMGQYQKIDDIVL